MATVLNDVVQIPNVFNTNHFDFVIPNPPGGGAGARDLTIRNMSAQLRVMGDFDPMRVVLHRHAVRFAGKGVVDGDFTATYIDTSDKRVTTTLEAWYLRLRNDDTGLPSAKSGYVTDCWMVIYDMNNNPSIYRTYFNVWVGKVNPVDLDGDPDNPLRYSVTFNYDYFKLGKLI